MSPLELGLSFVEGLALIASPCILPVLPLVLSASIDGGRSRPFGIITGFVLSFSIFAFASRKIVEALHIDVSVIRDASLVLLFLFGLVLLSGKLSQKFSQLTQGAADLGSRIGSGNKGGYGSGVLIGALIGLVWTPCAGPILAAVLVQVIRQQSDLNGIAIILSFAIGAGIPMLIIALMGRKIMARLGFFTKHSESIRKVFGVLILLSVGFIASGVDAASLLNRDTPVVTASTNGLQGALPQPYAAPEFTGIEQWLNSKPLTMASLKGKVVLIDFWTYSCINCVRTLPYVTAWDAKYRDKGLVIIGISAPEFEFEKNAENVKAALEKHGIHYPVALDNHLDTWSAFSNRYWPAHYLIDQNGRVVYTHFGEGKYDETEHNIRQLLGLKDAAVTQPAAASSTAGQTNETYLGTSRASTMAADGTAPATLPKDHWALSGGWQHRDENIVTTAGASLSLNFTARKVFLVMGTATGKPIAARILLNGKPVGDAAGKDVKDNVVQVDRNTLYELIDQKQFATGTLTITTDAPGLEAYAFTFGN